MSEGPDRRPSRAQARSSADREEAPEHLPEMRVALSRRRARGDALGVAGTAATIFPMRARARIDWYTDAGSFVEEAADVRSEDPLDFFSTCGPTVERLSEAESEHGSDRGGP